MANESNVKDVTAIDTSDERKAFDSLDTEEKVDETKSDEKDTEESKEDGEETEEEIVDEEEKEEENADDDEDEVAADSLYQQLKAKDKNIFKEIPELKEVLFRERAYTERFPTVKDADAALEALNTLNGYNDDILSGKSDTILESLERIDKDALKEFVGNFIPSVEKLNKDLYYEMIGPELKKLFRAYSKHSDERISVSAKNLHYAVFNNHDIDREVGLKRSESKKSEGEENLTKKQKEFEDRVVHRFTLDVKQSCESRIKRSISSAFVNSGLSQLMQNKLTEEILNRVGEDLQKDTRHMGGMNSLWRQAKAAEYNDEWKDRIVNAYLSRAKALVPKHRQKVLAEAKLNVKTEEGKEKKEAKRVIPSNQTGNRSLGQGKIDPKKIDWNKTDERAMLDGKITYKN